LVTRSSPKRTVLVADDDEVALEALGDLLEHAGYRVLLAPSGEEALCLLRDADPAPDMILLDLMMPGMDGWQVVSRLRVHPALSEVPVVIMSAGGSAVLATAPVADAYVAKPLQANQLLHVVQRTLTLADMRKRPGRSSGVHTVRPMHAPLVEEPGPPEDLAKRGRAR